MKTAVFYPEPKHIASRNALAQANRQPAVVVDAFARVFGSERDHVESRLPFDFLSMLLVEAQRHDEMSTAYLIFRRPNPVGPDRCLLLARALLHVRSLWSKPKSDPRKPKARAELAAMASSSGETWWISAAGSKALAGRRSRDTGPEMILRSALHRTGLRYRVHTRIGERMTVDVDFTRAKVAVFVDGHYWHSCPFHPRPIPRGPNAVAWTEKFARIDERELRARRLLEARGYVVLRYPECVVRDQTKKAVSEIRRIVRRRSI